ncbi:hypothetical protein D3C76_511060 [compost metagenome]
MQIRVEIDAIKRNGVNKRNNPYFILSAYAQLPGFKHPQLIEFYCETLHNPGTQLVVPVVASVKDGKASFDCDFAAAQIAVKQAA